MDSNNLLRQLLMVSFDTLRDVSEQLSKDSRVDPAPGASAEGKAEGRSEDKPEGGTSESKSESRFDPEQVKSFAVDLMQQIKTEQANWEAQMQRQLKNMLQELGVPRQNEMDELRGRIDRLERQVRDLENKLWR
jgi:polyhydroxyalkanoate synthesis regulator phasin